jgi:hypothetical protein
MNPNASPNPAMIRLALAPATEADYLQTAVRLIRGIPQVLRVRADLTARRLEILYREPTETIVRRIHESLAAAGQPLAGHR